MGLGYNKATRLDVRKRTSLNASIALGGGVTGTLSSPTSFTALASQPSIALSASGTLTPLPTWGTVAPTFYAGLSGSYPLPIVYATSVTFAPGSATPSWLSISTSGGGFFLNANGTQTAGTTTGVKLRATNTLASPVDSATFSVTVATAILENPTPAATGSYGDVWNMWFNADVSNVFYASNDVSTSWGAGVNARGSDPYRGLLGMARYYTSGSQPTTLPDGFAQTIANLQAASPNGITLFTPLSGGFQRVLYDELGGKFFHGIPG